MRTEQPAADKRVPPVLTEPPTAGLTGRAVRLPYDFGDIVYHRTKKDKIPGMVIGFLIVPGVTKLLVRWGDDLCQVEHYFFEVSSEHEPELA
jgi:hypothetical protein